MATGTTKTGNTAQQNPQQLDDTYRGGALKPTKGKAAQKTGALPNSAGANTVPVPTPVTNPTDVAPTANGQSMMSAIQQGGNMNSAQPAQEMTAAQMTQPSGSAQTQPQPFNMEKDTLVWGDEAAKRNAETGNFLTSRNQQIADSIGSQLGDVSKYSDSDLKRIVTEQIAAKGAPMDNAQIGDTIASISQMVRQGSGMNAASADDYFYQVLSGKTVPLQNNPAAVSGMKRAQNFQMYRAMTPQQLATSIGDGQLTIGSQSYNDLVNNGYGQLIQQAQQLQNWKVQNKTVESAFSVLTTDPTKSLSTQQTDVTQQPDMEYALTEKLMKSLNTSLAQDFQTKLLNDPEVTRMRDNARSTKAKIDDLNDTLSYMADDLKAQIIADGGEVTAGYLTALVAERSKPVIRQLQALQTQYSTETSELEQYTDNIKSTMELEAKDRANYASALQVGLQYVQKQKAEAAAAEQAQLQAQEKMEAREYDWMKTQAGWQVQEMMNDKKFQQEMAMQGIKSQSDMQMAAMKSMLENGMISLEDLPGLFSGGGGMGGGGGTYTGDYDFSGVVNPLLGKGDSNPSITKNDAGLNNNNPGNLRPANGITYNGVIGTSPSNFVRFATPQDGWNALVQDITAKQKGGSRLPAGSTLLDMIKMYAPEEDGNNPGSYAQDVAAKLGVNVNTKINTLDTNKLAMAIASHESPGMYNLLFGGQGSNTSQQTNGNAKFKLSPNAQAVMDGDALITDFTPTQKSNILNEMKRKGVFDQYGVGNTTFMAMKKKPADLDSLSNYAITIKERIDQMRELSSMAGWDNNMWNSMGNFLGIGSSKFNTLKTISGKTLADYIKSISGAAVSDNEANRLAALVPNVNDKPSTFKTKLDQFEREYNNILNAKIKAYGFDDYNELKYAILGDTASQTQGLNIDNPFDTQLQGLFQGLSAKDFQ